MDAMARDRFEQPDRLREGGRPRPRRTGEAPPAKPERDGGGRRRRCTLIPIIELCRCCPGMVTAMGVSMGLTSAAIMRQGHHRPEGAVGARPAHLDKIGAWAITEPGSGSDAFGSMKSTARRDGDEYVLNGSKTFITNGPYADTIVFICKLDEGNPPDGAQGAVSFVLDTGMPGLEQSKPLRKMGMHSSPTGELFLDRRAGRQRPPDRRDRGRRRRRPRGRQGHVPAWSAPAWPPWRSASSSSASSCRVDYAKDRVQFGQPIGEFQLIQDKLARMEVARLNVAEPGVPHDRDGGRRAGHDAWPRRRP